MIKCDKFSQPCYQLGVFKEVSDMMDHAIFTREGGVSDGPFESMNVRYGIGDDEANVDENRKRVMYAMELGRFISADQIHSNNILLLNAELEARQFLQFGDFHEVQGYDGFLTRQTCLGLMIQVADCQALIFFDPEKQALGLLHAGWRGLKQNIIAKMVNMMIEHYDSDPANILVGCAPSLGPLSAEFSDPLAELGADFEPFISGRHVNLWDYSYWQLLKLGIPEDNIEIARVDTVESDEFFSYRGDGKVTGRFAVCAFLK